MDAAAWLEVLTGLPLGWLLLGLFLGSLIEYLVPPFPGDTVVVAGAAVAAASEVSWGWVLAAVTAGAVVGTAVDWWVGRRAAGRLESLSEKRRAQVARLARGFERWGPALLVLNRFAPGVRALFFVAAGVAGLRLVPVVAWATVSATLWNLLLMGIGAQVGWNLDRLLPVVARVGWVGLVLVLVVLAAWWWSAARSGEHDPEAP